jgi:mannose-6-phosphate isomerase-like protein (cupin superfamily)
MPFLHHGDARVIDIPGASFTCLAAPSLGATDNAAWIVTLAPGTPGLLHKLTREETFVCIEGAGLAEIGGQAHAFEPGSALTVPAGVEFALSNPGAAPFRAVVVLPVGGQAVVGEAPPFTPPWAQ